MLHCLSRFCVVSVLAFDLTSLPDEASPEEGASKKFPWKSWVSIAIKRKLRIINWPNTIPPPGPGFIYHTIEAEEIKLLLGDFIQTVREGGEIKHSNVPRIKCWRSGLHKLTWCVGFHR
jgi:hypothetical protein